MEAAEIADQHIDLVQVVGDLILDTTMGDGPRQRPSPSPPSTLQKASSGTTWSSLALTTAASRTTRCPAKAAPRASMKNATSPTSPSPAHARRFSPPAQRPRVREGRTAGDQPHHPVPCVQKASRGINPINGAPYAVLSVLDIPAGCRTLVPKRGLPGLRGHVLLGGAQDCPRLAPHEA